MSTLVRWEPTRELASLRDRVDRLFGETFGRAWGDQEGLTSGAWIPPVDVFESEDHIVLKADLPDVNKDEVDISVQNNTLTIKGERKMEDEVKEKNFYRMERTYGAFTRSFTLPPTIDSERIDANFNNGVLTLTLPKREESKPKQIKVKVSGNTK